MLGIQVQRRITAQLHVFGGYLLQLQRGDHQMVRVLSDGMGLGPFGLVDQGQGKREGVVLDRAIALIRRQELHTVLERDQQHF
ncbi:hypothetical protein D3C76_1192770 [compost metagenome]